MVKQKLHLTGRRNLWCVYICFYIIKLRKLENEIELTVFVEGIVIQKKEDDKNTALWFGRKFFTNSGIEFDFFCR